ncbi:hypothetical protein [Streptomyces albipurpureus]|uniref:Uncharacterized protein n=1 Tax=Streptomyces albipurpureus TaxID=2897419 RepID=A0ABT0ULS2_9ACTN|nr:hypothetical protein [Streptomyces sp. CWNU-1]MCM2388974.1 hypothetical protein [Streptomyces sp. CWNU-1]
MTLLIRRALTWVLNLLLPPRGKHAAASAVSASPAQAPEPVRIDPFAHKRVVWEQGWGTPTPRHVVERHQLLRGEDSRLIRPYTRFTDDTVRLRPIHVVQAERRLTLVYATAGLDLPDTYLASTFAETGSVRPRRV